MLYTPHPILLEQMSPLHYWAGNQQLSERHSRIECHLSGATFKTANVTGKIAHISSQNVLELGDLHSLIT